MTGDQNTFNLESLVISKTIDKYQIPLEEVTNTTVSNLILLLGKRDREFDIISQKYKYKKKKCQKVIEKLDEVGFEIKEHGKSVDHFLTALAKDSFKRPSNVKPKKTAFMFFAADQRKMHSTNQTTGKPLTFHESSKQIGELWSKLKLENKEEYEKYLALGKKDAERWNSEIKAMRNSYKMESSSEDYDISE
jgi:hypothetical protein